MTLKSEINPLNTYDVILTCDYSPWSKYHGGGQKSTHTIAEELCKLGLKVCVVYSKSLFEKIKIPQTNYDIQWTFFFAIKAGASPFRYLNGLSFFLKIKKLSAPNTIIHSNGGEGSLLGYIKKKRKFIYTNRYPNFKPKISNQNWSKKWTWVKIGIMQPRILAIVLGLSKADIVTCTSQFSKKQIKPFIQTKHPIRIIYNGIDPLFLKSDIPNYKNQKGILFFGRLTEEKGVKILLESYQKLPSYIQKNHPLTILGEGKLKHKVLQATKKYPITWKTWHYGEKLIQEIQKVKLVVLPSLEESFGNTTIETLALGQNLITSNQGSLSEILGNYGNQIKDISVEKLYQTILNHLSIPINLDKLLNQKKWACEQYSWNKVAKQYLLLYQS